MSTYQTLPTQYITASNGTKYAYRRFGPTNPNSNTNAPPLVLHIHFRANMDLWDPSLLNALARRRSVIVFDSAGVGRSSGAVPTHLQGWADQVLALVEALGLRQVDVFGFSMGGGAAQMMALNAPKGLVRKVVLGGTTASQPGATSDIRGIVWPREIGPTMKEKSPLMTARTPGEMEKAIELTFFPETEKGRGAAREYWQRVKERNVPGEPNLLELLDNENGTRRQYAALQNWNAHDPAQSYDRLGELSMPVLVLNGDNDVLIPTSRSWELLAKIPDAQLIIYPLSGHGFIWQYAELVAAHVNEFLDRQAPSSKL